MASSALFGVVWRPAGPVALVACLAGCAAPSGPVQDEYEAENRQVHEMNKQLDRMFVRPVAEGTSDILPDEVEVAILNASSTWEAPGDAVNYLLQVKPGKAVESGLRFAINATIGVGGIFDAATALGIPNHSTTFGDTLYVWGMPEGNYEELPLLGPSTDRDSVGRAVGGFLNPLDYVVNPTQGVVLVVLGGASMLVERGRYSDTVDSVLYDSADSYAQTRLLYTQNRRFELGDTGEADDGFIDPYADDGSAQTDGASDAVAGAVPLGFEDPYAE